VTTKNRVAGLAPEPELLLTDLVDSETVYVLESFYEEPCKRVAESVRSLIAMEPCVSVVAVLLFRAFGGIENRPSRFR
jgi:hypothetical protein